MGSIEEDNMDPGPARQGNAPVWRDAVRAAAQEAALALDKAKWDRLGCTVSLFAYRWEHVQAVVRLAMRLATLTGADREIVEAAAWLHDVGKGAGSEDHGCEGAAAARTILGQTDFPPRKIEAVADAIAKHVGYARSEPVGPLEAAVIWDADKLTWLGATSVLHIVGSAVERGRATTVECLEDLANGAWREGIARTFHTAPARAAGRRRVEAYRAFYQQAAREFNGGDLLVEEDPDGNGPPTDG
jgi:uncharacterized protein